MYAMQQILSLKLETCNKFSNFQSLGNESLVEMLKTQAKDVPHVLVCQQSSGAGLSHLLQATCHHYAVNGKVALYLSVPTLLAEAMSFEGIRNVLIALLLMT